MQDDDHNRQSPNDQRRPSADLINMMTHFDTSMPVTQTSTYSARFNPLIQFPVNQSINQLISEPISQSMIQTFNQSTEFSQQSSNDQHMSFDNSTNNDSVRQSMVDQSIYPSMGNRVSSVPISNQQLQYFNQPSSEQYPQQHEIMVKQQFVPINNPAVIPLGHRQLSQSMNSSSHHVQHQPINQPIRHRSRSPSLMIQNTAVQDMDPFTESVNRAIPPYISVAANTDPIHHLNQSIHPESQPHSVGGRNHQHTTRLLQPYPSHPPHVLRRASAPSVPPFRSTNQQSIEGFYPNSMHNQPRTRMAMDDRSNSLYSLSPPSTSNISSQTSSSPNTPMLRATTTHGIDQSSLTATTVAALTGYRFPLYIINVKRVKRVTSSVEEESTAGVGVNYQQRFNASIALPPNMLTEPSMRGKLVITAKALPIAADKNELRLEPLLQSPQSPSEIQDAQDREMLLKIYDARPYFSLTFTPNTRGGFQYTGNKVWNGTVECHPPCRSLTIECIITQQCQVIEFTGTMERPDAMYNKRRELWNPVELQIEWVPDVSDPQPVCAWVTLIRGSRRIPATG